MSPPLLTRRGALALLGSTPALALPRLSPADEAFLDDLSRRAFLYFWEQASPQTGLVRDRARNADGQESRNVASSAATGFGLTALAIAGRRGWLPREDLLARALLTLRFCAERAPQEHGWFYHFTDADTGARVWESEISSIDTALLLAGVLTARQHFDQPEVIRLAGAIVERVDFQWMLNGHPYLLSHGWKPETLFLPYRWDQYCELAILYLLAIGSPTYPIPAGSWYAWARPTVTYTGFTYISGAPLFSHQYSHAWIDFRRRLERRGPRTNWFQNSVDATLAHRQFCIDLGNSDFPGCYSPDLWGITASDSAKGYVAWGGPPPHPDIDGSIVPCAAAGSLMFAPELCMAALKSMKDNFGGRIWNRYGFCDAFHPLKGWTGPDVLGINLGITLLSAENARSASVWRMFMENSVIRDAFQRISMA